MKRLSAIILILLALSIRGYSQDTLPQTKPSQYAIVYIESKITHYTTIAEYSDGTKEDLSKNYDLGYSVYLDNHIYELRLLDYFYKKGYELVCVTGKISVGDTKYYFKHK